MKLKPTLAIALASAFAFSTLGAYAQQDEKKDEKKPYVISQSDEKKDEKKPYQSDEKKDKKKPELISDKNEPPYPIQSEFELVG
jgi:hypothetical protein